MLVRDRSTRSTMGAGTLSAARMLIGLIRPGLDDLIREPRGVRTADREVFIPAGEEHRALGNESPQYRVHEPAGMRWTEEPCRLHAAVHRHLGGVPGVLDLMRPDREQAAHLPFKFRGAGGE